MRISPPRLVRVVRARCLGWLVVVACLALPQGLRGEPVVPGTGERIVQVGDDFEAEDWQYVPRNPKSSRDLDESPRLPSGVSQNGRWYEGMKRGHPDIVRRVETPARGLPGSTGALLLQTQRSGVPGFTSYRMQQDDFIADCNYRLGGAMPVWQSPSVVTRVFLPPVDLWENRTGPTFGFRLALTTTVTKPGRGRFATPQVEKETYWPGMFIEFQSKGQGGAQDDYASFRIRGDSRGGDFRGPQITQTGWWTLGMSVTADGMVHYYARPGVEDLTPADFITSQYPYGYRAEHFKTFFFNVCNRDDGRTWSTPWIVDDSYVYYIRSDRMARTPSRP